MLITILHVPIDLTDVKVGCGGPVYTQLKWFGGYVEPYSFYVGEDLDT